MKRVSFLFLILASLIASGQKSQDSFFIRDYRYSLTLSFNHTTKGYNVYNDIGAPIRNNLAQHSYLFHAHENDLELGLVLFPSRLYSFNKSRFFQPDPESQFFSPYLFTNGDPINFVDRDGNTAKPLVLYEKSHIDGDLIQKNLHDFRTQVPDAHYVPLSDFMSSPNIPLQEWNGNVFILSHMGEIDKAEIAGEVSRHPDMLQLQNKEGANIFYNTKEETYEALIDGKALGRRLRHIAELNNVRVNNVVAGGCNGTFAAQRIGEGYAQASAESSSGRLHTFGLRRKIQGSYLGKHKINSDNYISGIESTRFYPLPEGYPYDYNFSKSASERPIVDGYRLDTQKTDLIFEKYAEGEELNHMANGRIPPKISQFFDEHIIPY